MYHFGVVKEKRKIEWLKKRWRDLEGKMAGHCCRTKVSRHARAWSTSSCNSIIVDVRYSSQSSPRSAGPVRVLGSLTVHGPSGSEGWDVTQ